MKVIKFAPGLIPVLKHEEHDQSTHGSWAKGGNGLGIEAVMKLHRTLDPLQRKVYEAERSIDPPLQPYRSIAPKAPKYDDFSSRGDYDKAYKEYNKKWTAWAVEEQAKIVSDTGKELLDGTPAGVKKYVEEVIKQDWFVERFGDGSSLPRLEVKTANTTASGRHILKVQKDSSTGRIVKTVHEISIDRQFVKNETTILHEISHYATAISQTESFEAHGVEFARNHTFVVEQVAGSARAQALEIAYKSKGVTSGN
jgi:putative metallohydrolase (TIGR04338 family)